MTANPNVLGQPTGGQGGPTAVKIAVIGAGSAVFSTGIVRDICLTPSLAGSTVHFMDIDTERLGMIHQFATRYANELGSNVRFEQSVDRESALEGADFVINTAMLGGRQGQDAERELGTQYGYYRGMYQATKITENFRQMRLMLGIAREMEQLCPDAWLIQSSNPVYEGTTLVSRETGIKMIGLCHGYMGYRDIADVLELEPERISFVAPGLNHCIWMTEFSYDGKDAYPLLDEWIATKAESYWRTWNPKFNDTQMAPAAIDQYRLLGLLPLGDTTRTFTEWQYHVDLPNMQRWYGPMGGFDSEIGWSHYLQRLSQRIESIWNLIRDEKASLTDAFPPAKTIEQQVPIIDALVNDNAGTFQVNVLNGKAIDGIPANVAVEGPARIDRSGLRLLPIGVLPRPLMLHMITPRVLDMERTIEAFKTGDPRLLESILLWDHRTRTPEQGQAYLDALFNLPINADMRDHFASHRSSQTLVRA